MFWLLVSLIIAGLNILDGYTYGVKISKKKKKKTTLTKVVFTLRQPRFFDEAGGGESKLEEFLKLLPNGML